MHVHRCPRIDLLLLTSMPFMNDSCACVSKQSMDMYIIYADHSNMAYIQWIRLPPKLTALLSPEDWSLVLGEEWSLIICSLLLIIVKSHSVNYYHLYTRGESDIWAAWFSPRSVLVFFFFSTNYKSFMLLLRGEFCKSEPAVFNISHSCTCILKYIIQTSPSFLRCQILKWHMCI